MLHCGATIADINCVRKHLSRIKGGRLAQACYPAQLITYAISDVPGDHPAVIASGPTVADATRSTEALGILQRYDIKVGRHVLEWLQDSDSETLKANDPAFVGSQFHLIATAGQSLQAAARAAREAGVEVLLLGDTIEGEAREVARVQAAMALARRRDKPGMPPCLILSGGETTVTVTGRGRGGRNTEFLLSLAIALQGTPGIYALAADTDGIDGTQDNAGAVLTPASWQRARESGTGCREPCWLTMTATVFLLHWTICWSPGQPARTSMIFARCWYYPDRNRSGASGTCNGDAMSTYQQQIHCPASDIDIDFWRAPEGVAVPDDELTLFTGPGCR